MSLHRVFTLIFRENSDFVCWCGLRTLPGTCMGFSLGLLIARERDKPVSSPLSAIVLSSLAGTGLNFFFNRKAIWKIRDMPYSDGRIVQIFSPRGIGRILLPVPGAIFLYVGTIYLVGVIEFLFGRGFGWWLHIFDMVCSCFHVCWTRRSKNCRLDSKCHRHPDGS